jgi:hypothetical protein
MAEGGVNVQFEGASLLLQVFDKIQTVTTGAIVVKKWRGAGDGERASGELRTQPASCSFCVTVNGTGEQKRRWVRSSIGQVTRTEACQAPVSQRV